MRTAEMPDFRAFFFGEKMITTSYRPSEYTIHTAQSLSVRLGDTYCSRNKQPIEKMLERAAGDL